jgi:tetratricopeptide (TPR) repeat protein
MSLLGSVANLLAQDDVVYRRNGIVVRGTIVAQDAAGIRMVQPDSPRELLIPADQVERVQVKLTPQQEQGDRLFEDGDYHAAASKFEEALNTETRRWLRARITSRVVACHVASGDAVAAIDAFLKASQAADGAVAMSIAPVWWLPEPPPGSSLQFASRLLQSSNPLEQVIGASLLFGTSQADAGREVLRKLTTYRDERIGQLARTQLWRWEASTVKPEDVASWQRQVTRLPPDSRGGPYFAIGLALQQHGRHDEAARAFLWPALVYRNDPKLACRALWLAAQCLESASQPSEARQLYSEVTVRFASNPEAASAQARLDALKE